MDGNTITRRAAMGMGLAATIFWLAPARAQATRLAKDAVKYVDKGDAPGKDCDDCLHYIAPSSTREPATCRIVDGPISPHGHCLAFTPKGKAAP